MPLAWRDTSEPVAAHPLATLADAHGTAAALGALAASRGAALTVVLPRALHGEVIAFLAARDVEAGGLLLGRRYAVVDGSEVAVVGVERFVPGHVAEGTGTSLALGTAIWDDARPLLDAGLAVVGWVHSHPDLGAFFSGTDRRTQRAFFAQPWQFGWVVDPVRREQAWFRGGGADADGLRLVAG
jgi:proteasome lid subunit RPN8/RPN11